jgi:hypothetical protein
MTCWGVRVELGGHGGNGKGTPLVEGLGLWDSCFGEHDCALLTLGLEEGCSLVSRAAAQVCRSLCAANAAQQNVRGWHAWGVMDATPFGKPEPMPEPKRVHPLPPSVALLVQCVLLTAMPRVGGCCNSRPLTLCAHKAQIMIMSGLRLCRAAAAAGAARQHQHQGAVRPDHVQGRRHHLHAAGTLCCAALCCAAPRLRCFAFWGAAAGCHGEGSLWVSGQMGPCVL